MTVLSKDPIVILGGFLSPGAVYNDMRRDLANLTGRTVSVVNTQMYDWFLSFTQAGWARILSILDRTVRSTLRNSSAEKVIVIGHSQGGVLARLYLNPEPFRGRRYNGLAHVAQLITLGSPHINQGGVQRGGPVSRWMNRHFPGAYFAPEVAYTCVAGKAIKGDPNGSTQQRFVSRIYKEICGSASPENSSCAWGDGIVPVHAALLPGAQHIILDGIAHYSIAGGEWYGSKEVLPRWWQTPEME